MRGRVVVPLLVVCGLSAGCSSVDVPGFCGVSDTARVAIGGVDPSKYPAESAKHVQELKDSASGLSGDQGKLANTIVEDLQAASEAKPGSLKFTNLYNKFVTDSNRFDHKYCNATEGPDF